MTNCKKIRSVAAPYAYITKGKQRVKQFIDTVYLQNGDEFEIELFNPTSNKVLAKIEVNGKSIGGGGIVLRPGERAYLERFIDDNKKFIFETYNVSNSKSSKKAIEKNGILKVEFYDEQPPSFPWYGGCITISEPIIYGTPTPSQPFFYTTGMGTIDGQSSLTLDGISTNNFYASSDTTNFNDVNATFTNTNKGSSCGGVKKSSPTLRKLSNKIETGRIEKGSISNQSFQHDSTAFNAWYSWQSTWKILPISQKQVTTNEIKVYCTECGARRKKSTHKFCPNCGTRF